MLQFKAPQGSPGWRTNVPPTGMVVGVVGIHDMGPRARLCRAAGDMVARDALLVGVLHALIAMMANIDLTLYVMLVIVRVMAR